MSAALDYILSIVALILMGVFATFLVLLNYIKDEEQRKENGKTSEQNIRRL